MHVFKLASTRGLSESFWVKNMPVQWFFSWFCGKFFGARLKYFEYLHNQMNIVVEMDFGSGRCRKKLFYIFQ